MSNHLFVYGTLRRVSRNSKFHLLADAAQFLGPARMSGRLFHLGTYPGLVPSRDPDAWVQGELYLLDRPPETLARLDHYEGCGPNDPVPHKFERIEHDVVREAGGPERAWVYVYRGATGGKSEIVPGDYCQEFL